MNRRTFLSTAALFGIGCGGARIVADDGALDIFRREHLDGAFVLFDSRSSTTTLVNPAQARAGYLPASTFKIPNTLIGLETGVIPDEGFALKWDGKKHSFSEHWNRDHDLASAMKFSVVWFYQEIARRIGYERMQQFVRAFDYGNHNISGGLDDFWLAGALRISPVQQVDFLRRMRNGQLPVRPQHVERVMRIIELERREDRVLRGKTGLTEQDERVIGWFVGFVDRKGGWIAYATLILGVSDDVERIIPARKELTAKLLARFGVG